MHVIPGNVVDAGEPEIVRLFERWGQRGLDNRLLDIRRQAVEHAANARESTTVVVMVMHRAESGEGGTLWGRAWTGRRGRTVRADRIGKCLARGKHKRGCAKRRDQRRSIGHGTQPHHRLLGIFPTLSRACRARKDIINGWLRRNLNGCGHCGTFRMNPAVTASHPGEAACALTSAASLGDDVNRCG